MWKNAAVTSPLRLPIVKVVPRLRHQDVYGLRVLLSSFFRLIAVVAVVASIARGSDMCLAESQRYMQYLADVVVVAVVRFFVECRP